jgi:hypothetical protein
VGLNGRPYYDEIVKTERKDGKTKLKPRTDNTGTLEMDHPMIIFLHQRNGLTYFDVSVCKSDFDIVCNNVKYGNTIFTDQYRGYESLEDYRFIHKSINYSEMKE